MNAIGIALVWCIVQVSMLGLLAAALYLLLRRLRPAAAAPVVLTALTMTVLLSLMAFSPWPRWLANLPSPACGRGAGGEGSRTCLRWPARGRGVGGEGG